MHARVEIINGDHVGTVTAVARDRRWAHRRPGVSLDSGKVVWIDAADVRLTAPTAFVMTNLDQSDLHQMADERF